MILGKREILAATHCKRLEPRIFEVIFDALFAQRAADVAWLEEDCMIHNWVPIVRRYCPLCWEDFMAAGKE